MENILHLVSFNIPFPADNGGLIDVFCKIKALHESGTKIILHCWEYGRPEQKELEKYCIQVHYYKRNTGKSLLFQKLPYIVAGRRTDELIQNLKKDDFPILFEGLHCCADLDSAELKNRRKFVRMHNIEHEYYRHLAKAEKDIFKRYYFYNEAGKLESFEKILRHAEAVFAISASDDNQLNTRYGNSVCVPAFHLNDSVVSKPGKSNFALYHGSLEVGENNLAALWLCEEVFNDLPFQLIIAGNNPSAELRKKVESMQNVCIKTKLSTEQIQILVSEAQINVLPTFQATGIKLKLLMALFSGRHCLVNPPMVQGTGLERICRIANNAIEMKTAVNELFAEEFTEDYILQRKNVLENDFSNLVNAKKINSRIFGNQ